MEKINIKETETTPAIILNAEDNKFLIEGKSLPENVNLFYEPIILWFEEYTKNPNEKTVIDIKLEYINTASSKSLFSLFLKLESIHQSGKEVCVNWHYADDDEDMKDVGEEYEDVIKVPFNHIEFESED